MLRTMTVVWGAVLLGEAVVRTILVYELTVTEFLALSNFVMYGFIGAAIVFTVSFRKRAKKRFEQLGLK